MCYKPVKLKRQYLVKKKQKNDNNDNRLSNAPKLKFNQNSTTWIGVFKCRLVVKEISQTPVKSLNRYMRCISFHRAFPAWQKFACVMIF